jgi:hypothetical protein
MKNAKAQRNARYPKPAPFVGAQPPANIATPSLGSEVAVTLVLAKLRAAVVQVPLLALKMSTTLKKT